MKSHLNKMDGLTGDLRKIDQLVVSLEYDVRQPRLTIEAARKLASALKVPLKHFKRGMGITFLQKGPKKARRARPLSA